MYCWLRLKVGTGKSTLIKFIVAALNIPNEEVAYIAYTGKATTVLASKGCKNAITAHKFLYDAYQDPITAEVKFSPKTELEGNYRLIVVDPTILVKITLIIKPNTLVDNPLNIRINVEVKNLFLNIFIILKFITFTLIILHII